MFVHGRRGVHDVVDERAKIAVYEAAAAEAEVAVEPADAGAAGDD